MLHVHVCVTMFDLTFTYQHVASLAKSMWLRDHKVEDARLAQWNAPASLLKLYQHASVTLQHQCCVALPSLHTI